jgi:HAD superfamily hydrolase (TIGR01549 family)
MRSFQAVLFDLDNTLYDHTHSSREALIRMVRELESLTGVDPEILCREFQRHNDECWALAVRGEMTREELRLARFTRTLRALGLDLEAAELSRAYLEGYARFGREVPGARSTVLCLLEGLPVGIVTNGYPDMVEAKLEAVGLAGLVHPVVVADRLEDMKPRAACFRQALAALGMEAADVLYVGDAPEVDVVGAREAGLATCWFDRNGAGWPSELAHPDLTIRNLPELELTLRGASSRQVSSQRSSGSRARRIG